MAKSVKVWTDNKGVICRSKEDAEMSDAWDALMDEIREHPMLLDSPTADVIANWLVGNTSKVVPLLLAHDTAYKASMRKMGLR